jgi:hypothetical protein
MDPRDILRYILLKFLGLIREIVYWNDGLNIEPLGCKRSFFRREHGNKLPSVEHSADSQDSQVRLINLSLKPIMHSQGTVPAEEDLSVRSKIDEETDRGPRDPLTVDFAHGRMGRLESLDMDVTEL